MRIPGAEGYHLLDELQCGSYIFRYHPSLAFLDEEALARLHIRWECPLSAEEILFPADLVGRTGRDHFFIASTFRNMVDRLDMIGGNIAYQDRKSLATET